MAGLQTSKCSPAVQRVAHDLIHWQFGSLSRKTPKPGNWDTPAWFQQPRPKHPPQWSLGFPLPTRKMLPRAQNHPTVLGSQQWLCRWSGSLEEFCELICSRQWAEEDSPLLPAEPLRAAQQAELLCSCCPGSPQQLCTELLSYLVEHLMLASQAARQWRQEFRDASNSGEQ